MLYQQKPINVIEARQFETNNEPDNANMNALCLWVNQGRETVGVHAWHNGTVIVLTDGIRSFVAQCGDFIGKNGDGEFSVIKAAEMAEHFERVPTQKEQQQ